MESQRDIPRGKQRPSPAQQEFLFVDTAKAKSSRQGRRNARSFVMQKARRERPWSTSKHVAKQRKSPETTSPATGGTRTPDHSHTPITSTPSPPLAPTRSEYLSFSHTNRPVLVKQEVCPDCQVLTCQFGQPLCPVCLAVQAQASPEDIDNSSVDPFNTLSIEMDENTSVLIEHFITQMAPAAIAIDIQNKSDLMNSAWFGTARVHAGFMHSLLCTAALHRYYMYGGKGSFQTILYHRHLAVAAINSALSNLDMDDGLSDANIGAVFNLLTIEESLVHIERNRREDGQTDQRRVHYDGLRQMIQLRGGLLAIGSNRILQAFILWHSTAHAIATFEAPYLTAEDLTSAVQNPRHPPGYLPNISHHLLDCCRVAQVRVTLMVVVEAVLILIADLNSLFSDPHSPLDPVSVQNYACVLECMLLQWLRNNEHVSPLEDALCITLLIFTVRTTEALRVSPTSHPFHIAANKKLEQALSATSRVDWYRCPELLVYILAIGAISSEGSIESLWFVHQASLACSAYGIQSAEMLLERLHMCGWVNFKLDRAVCHLWDRIINSRSENHTLESSSPDEANTVGPLQVRVASPEFVDWQEIDWSILTPFNNEHAQSSGSNMAGNGSEPGAGSEEPLYEFGSGYVSTS
ncbi:hypothetical protein DM02DRAFT_690515 [Periconia macrospinosa]|uniref:Transcription factor domain-containing protein n=1 Tax=Periconia macrospinosa TaxID=97972 RepID=A0A2V1ED92_9PLEO|nr:hypothetical protein DM02DRAFT_690515 [Periconia macrospinosa]